MTTDRMLQGKVVVVTGAGAGIGRDLALALAREGARVVVNDVGDAAHQVVAEIRSAGGEALASVESVSEAAAAQRIVDAAVDAFGRIDGVVNNAGILRDRIFHKMGADEWDAVIRVHLYGSYYVSRAAANHFKEQDGGAFVHMTSTSGLIGNLGQANYNAAKMGIAALSKSIALDMQKFNVRSNCIAPFAWTAMTSSIPTDTPDQVARVEKFKQMTPAKIAPLAVYLLSDAAAGVNAQIFTVRNNEIFLMSQPRPVRSVHRQEGWTARSLAEHGMPALKSRLRADGALGRRLQLGPGLTCARQGAQPRMNAPLPAAAALDLARWIRPGDTVLWGQADAEPVTLVRALAEQRHRFARTRVFLGVGLSGVMEPAHADAIDFLGYCGSGSNRRLAEAGLLDIWPGHYSDLPARIRSGALRIDVLMLQVPPADARDGTAWAWRTNTWWRRWPRRGS